MLGYISEREGKIEEAARWTSLALEASAPLHKHEYIGYGLLFAADLVHRAGETDGAARLLGASGAAFDRAAVIPQAEEAERLERVRGLVAGELGADRFGALGDRGAELDIEPAVDLGVTALGAVRG